MKVIITGATGFIGRNFAENFHDNGLQVVATGRSSTVGDELQKKGIEFHAANIIDSSQLDNAFSPADCLIHCAARAGDWGKYQDFYQTNVLGTRNIINACKNHDIKKIIFISTPNIYYSGKDRYNISESDPIPARQRTYYAKTKIISERELLALQHEGYQVIIFRPRAVYGPYDNIIVPRILRMAEKKQMPLINNGQAMTDITYIDNLVDAVRISLTAPDNAWNEVYNICNGTPISIRDWFSQVLKVFGRPFKPKNVPELAAKIIAGIMEFFSLFPFSNKKPLMTRFSVGYMAKSMTMSIEKAKQLLNYSPRIRNQQGFEMYAKWCQSK